MQDLLDACIGDLFDAAIGIPPDARTELERVIHAVVRFDTQLARNGPVGWIDNQHARSMTGPVVDALRALVCPPYP